MNNVTVELIFTGNELLIGKTLNTNSQWLAKRIFSLGAQVTRMVSVSDDLEEISGELVYSIERRPNLIITSGGLGASFDDMTLEAVAKATKRPLILNETLLNEIKRIHKLLHARGDAKGHEITEFATKMAYQPKDSKMLLNPEEGVPGILLELEEGVEIVCLPGVPTELKAIFDQGVADIISNMVGDDIATAEARFLVDLIESEIAILIDKVMKTYPSVYIKSNPLSWKDVVRVEIHLTSRGEKASHVKENVRSATEMLKNLVVEGGGKIIDNV
ncbi:MAG: molybdopterin-binding protein [Promethearchaeota archaeon]